MAGGGLAAVLEFFELRGPRRARARVRGGRAGSGNGDTLRETQEAVPWRRYRT